MIWPDDNPLSQQSVSLEIASFGEEKKLHLIIESEMANKSFLISNQSCVGLNIGFPIKLGMIEISDSKPTSELWAF